MNTSTVSDSAAPTEFPPVGLFLRGMAMGAADVIPGVSGGTIALITGIYAHLIRSIKHCTDGGLKLLFNGDIRGFWQHIDGNFLVILLMGIVASVIGFSQILHYFLDTVPQLLWGFFLGLILASSVVLYRHLPEHGWADLLAMALGFVFAVGVALLNPVSLSVSPAVVFFAGMIAISAMILPGISGSFLLVLMGLYEAIIGAIKGMDFVIVLSFAGGCGVGVLAFSHVVAFLLSRFESLTLAFLTGIMLGALIRVWPWQTVAHDVQGPIDWAPWVLMPSDYLTQMGREPWVLGVIIMIILGAGLVFLLGAFHRRAQKASAV